MAEQVINTRFTADIGNTETAIRTVKRGLSDLGKSANDLTSPLRAAQAAIAGLGMSYFAKEVIDAALYMERLQRQFQVFTGSANLAGSEMQWVKDQANRLGLATLELTGSYALFLNAVKGTANEGQKARNAFAGISEGMAAIGMTADMQSRAWAQLNQGIMKGKFELEDLKTINEAGLPIFKLMADALGITTAEFMKQQREGKILANDVLPLLGESMHQAYGVAATEGAKSAQGQINLMNNAMLETKAVAGAALLPLFTDIVRGIQPAIEKLKEFVVGLQILSVKAAGMWDKFTHKSPGSNLTERFNSTAAHNNQVDQNVESQIADLMKRYTIPTSAYSNLEITAQKAIKTSTVAAQKKGLTDAQKETQKEIKEFLKNAWDQAANELAAEDFGSDAMKKMGLFTDKSTGFTKNPAFSLGVGQLQSLEQQADAAKDLETAEANRLKTLREQVLEYERQRDIVNYIKSLEAANLADAAAMVGMNASGGFDSIADQTSNALAIQKDAHEDRLRMIDAEQQANIDRVQSEEQALRTMAALDKATDLERRKNIIATGKIAADSYKAQLNEAADYTAMAGNLFSLLASTQDESSRKGFESAKDYNMGAAAMNTASAVMAQLTIPGPKGWIAAGLAAAAGLVQMDEISNTTYGSGGSVASPGSFDLSGGGSSVGSSIGSRILSNSDSQSQDSLQRLAAASDNASRAIGKVAAGFSAIADLFTEGGMAALASAAAPGSQVGLTSSPNVSFTKWLGGAVNPIGNAIKAMQAGDAQSAVAMWDPVSAYVSRQVFGGGWNTTAAGMSLGVTGGLASASDYVTREKDGGWFGDDKTKTTFTNDSEWTAVVNDMLKLAVSSITRAAATMGSSANINDVDMTATKIAVAGRTKEDVAKDLQSWLEKVAAEMALTVDGLDKFAYPGENAYLALMRLNDALVTTNDTFELLGVNLVESTMAGADFAYRLQDMFGGAAAFAESFDTYFTTMYTESEQKAMQAAQAQRQVNAAFAEMSITAPATRQEFTAIVDSYISQGDAGAGMLKDLMGIVPAFGLVADAAEKLAATNNNLMVSLYELQGRTVESIMLQRQLETEGMDPATLAIQNQIYALEDLNRMTDAQTALEQLKAQTIQDSTQAQIKMLQDSSAAFTATAEKLKANLLQILDIKISANQALLDIMGSNQTVLSPETLYQQKKAAFYATKTLADSGNAAAAAAFPELVKSFLPISQGYNASGAGYQADFAAAAETLGTIAGLPSTATLTLDVAQQQLFELKKIQEATTKGTSDQNVLLTGVKGGISGMQSMLQSYLQASTSAQSAAAAAATAQAKAAADSLAASQAANAAALTAAQAILDQAKAISSAQAALDAAKAEAATALALAQAQAAADAAAAAAAKAIYSTVPQEPLVRAANAILHPGQEYWLNNITGVKKWLPYGELPSFAIGTPYLQSDGPIYAHQGERIFPAADNYAITKAFVEGQSGNRELIAEIKELRKEVAKQGEANIRLQQAVGGRLIEVNEKQERRLAGVEAKTKLQDQAPGRKAA